MPIIVLFHNCDKQPSEVSKANTFRLWIIPSLTRKGAKVCTRPVNTPLDICELEITLLEIKMRLYLPLSWIRTLDTLPYTHFPNNDSGSSENQAFVCLSVDNICSCVQKLSLS